MTIHDQIFEMQGAGLCTLALFVPVSISFRFDLKRSHHPSSAKVVEASQPTKIWVESSADMVTSGIFVGGTCPKRKVFDRWVVVSLAGVATPNKAVAKKISLVRAFYYPM
jgi:hypothetical protein